MPSRKKFSKNHTETSKASFVPPQEQEEIESARLLDGNSLPEKIWLKQQFSIGVNDVTRVLERMAPSAQGETFPQRPHSISSNCKVPSVELQVVLLASDCNPRWLTKHLPSLASSRRVPVIFVKDKKGGSLRLGELVKLKTAIAIGIKSNSIMAKKLVKYSVVHSLSLFLCVVDAFTDSAFKGNPAAVCLLEEERDEQWLQAVAAEFNISETCYLTRLSGSDSLDSPNPRFRLRWFTPVAECACLNLLAIEVELCGHATLAAAHTLFSSGLVNSNMIEFVTLSGILTAKKFPETKESDSSDNQNGEVQEGFLIELNFPTVATVDFNSVEVSSISSALNGASVIDIKKTTSDILFVVVPSGETVVEIQPQIDAIRNCPGMGIIVSGAAPSGSGFDFYSRFFCPKLGINEDPVCGSAHCSLAPYWSKKLGKCDFVAYAASPRSGVLNIHLDEQNQRVLLRGKAVTVMEGHMNMAKKPVKYYVVDAFTDSVFKGNPAAVCFLEEDQMRNQQEWLQVVAAEFNIPTTCYLTLLTDTQSHSPNPRFRLRWFTPVAEVSIFHFH
uniref:Ribosomal protein eL8/eL30/eS12/Gadd45 domain-containing protein n=1 Tax=Fagus sylvatica TaxID=28930 RepID=A0A2N9G7Y0_FAGSY